MWKNLLGRIAAAVGEHPVAYTTVAFAFTVGLFCGVAYPSVMAEQEQASLIEYLRILAYSYSVSTPDVFAVFLQALLNNARILLVIFAAGFTRIGTPFAVGAEIVKGFGTGVSFGALCLAFGVSGFTSSLAVLLPQNLLYVPAYIYLGTVSVLRSTTRGGPPKLSISWKRYVRQMMPALLAIAAGILIESFLSTYLIKWISAGLL